MSEIRPDCLYTKDHEWVKKTPQGKIVVVGITDFAQASLGDVTFIQLPSQGKTFKKGEIIGTVESVKAVSDIYAPLSGTIRKINETLNQDPAPLNTDPFGKAWLLELEISDETELAKLLSPEAYASVAE
jgi:glycine cleavage system H protein